MAFTLLCPECGKPMTAREATVQNPDPTLVAEVTERVWSCDDCETSVPQTSSVMHEEQMRRLLRRSLHHGSILGLTITITFALIAGGVIGILVFLLSESTWAASITSIVVVVCLVVPDIVLRLRPNRDLERMICNMKAIAQPDDTSPD